MTDKKKRILCFGDSNTWGFNPQNGTRMDRRWTRLLDLDGAEILEEGLNSRNAFSMDEYAPEKCGIHSFNMMLMSHKPLDAVVIMLGTNDLKAHYHNTARNIANGLREYVRLYLNPTLYEGVSIPKLLVVSPIHLGDEIEVLEGEGGMFNGYSLQQSKLLAKEIETALAAYPVEFLDASRYAKPSAIDGIHMDEENHANLARAVEKKLSSMLEA